MGWLRRWRRRRVLARHRVDPALWRRVTAKLPFLRGLDAGQALRLQELALLFLAEKQFVGVRGQALDDAMRLSIAAQACLPILELGLDWYDGWSGIVIYPNDFRVRRSEVDEGGVVHEWDDELAGESWAGGPVVLSWDAAQHDEHANVVIHEFAHKLDMQSGEADGMPPLPTAWTATPGARRSRGPTRHSATRVERGRDTWLDPYAAEHPSEFFAVLSEAFFEAPNETRRRYPEMYDQLQRFYRQDPATRLRA